MAESTDALLKNSGNKIKFIFLDFDGVLNTEQYRAELQINGKPINDKYGPLFSPKSVMKLSAILERTHAKIVLTTSWRYIHERSILDEMWKDRKLPGEIYDILRTDTLFNDRGMEIKYFMKDYIQSPYVILDDINEFLPEQQKHYIEVNPIIGISSADVEKAVAILIESVDIIQ